MKQFEVILQKLDKNYCKVRAGRPISWPETQILNFPMDTTTHASRHLGEDFRKFSAKTNDKNWS